ncbi:hypothetical protein VNO78_35136 [Psophocarpus tetragonolobus]|uniref:Uncharacterized protein n=1 Tax=Psophocarpus tetragonolobus TaxID=3891 RepID=A0AAN9NM48_PSOTE
MCVFYAAVLRGTSSAHQSGAGGNMQETRDRIRALDDRKRTLLFSISMLCLVVWLNEDRRALKATLARTSNSKPARLLANKNYQFTDKFRLKPPILLLNSSLLLNN